MPIDDCKLRLPLPALWQMLGLPDSDRVRSGATVHSPFREDKTPSFYVKQAASGHWWWKDMKTGEQGDEITLLEVARSLSNADAIRLYHELAGLPLDPSPSSSSTAGAHPKRKKPALPKAPAPPAAPSPRPTDLRSVGVALSAAILAEPHPSPPPGYALTHHYTYQDHAGRCLHQTLRFTATDPDNPPAQGRKTFRQRRPVRPDYPQDLEHPKRRGAWIYSLDAPDFEPVPYLLPALLAHAAQRDAPLYLVEGEKDADNLAALGFAVTTVPMGAGKWRDSYAPYFQDLRVIVIADFDPINPQTGQRTGDAAALALAEKLLAAGARHVATIHMPDLWPSCPEKVDISDLIQCYLGALTPEEAAAEIATDLLAAERPLPLDLLFRDIYATGPRGGIDLQQALIARRLVAHHHLLHSGGAWWRWRRPGTPDAGTWRRIDEPEQIPRWIIDSLEATPATRATVSSHVTASIAKIMQAQRFIHPDQFNGHTPTLLNCRSGMLDVHRGIIVPHADTLYSTTQIPCHWDPEARAPLWLDSVLPLLLPEEDDRLLLQEIFGYCLVPGCNFHKFFFFYGEGGTGKSTTTNLLAALVGWRNTFSVRLEELANPVMRAKLLGRQLYLCPELTGDSFKHIGLIKAITSGDPISVDVKYEDPFDFRPKGRFVMSSNIPAYTPDASDGFGRRFLQIDFRHQIPTADQDFGLDAKLEAELPGVLVWAVEGFRRLHARGRFIHSRASEAALRDLLRQRSQVRSFIEDPEWVTIYPASDTSDAALTAYEDASDLHAAYLEWCAAHEIVKPYCDGEQGAGLFLRELFLKRPDLRPRKRELRDPVTRKRSGSRLMGLRLLRST